jgi:hypothetical protein
MPKASARDLTKVIDKTKLCDEEELGFSRSLRSRSVASALGVAAGATPQRQKTA